MITLCGILAANAALTEPDFGWMTDTIMLSGLGFLFSYGSRRLRIAPRALDFGFAAAALLALACVAFGQINVVQLLPLGADRRDLQLMSGLVWGSTLWSWTLRSDNRVVGATVPAMAVLGMAATIDVNTPVLVCFGAFILTVIFLLIHQNFLQNRGRAAGRPGAAPRRLLLAQLAQAGVCGLAVLLAGIVVIVRPKPCSSTCRWPRQSGTWRQSRRTPAIPPPFSAFPTTTIWRLEPGMPGRQALMLSCGLLPATASRITGAGALTMSTRVTAGKARWKTIKNRS